MSGTGEGAMLTLEPLIDAVRGAVEEQGWELSGLQKTTSHQFEGRWEGESTRSAYLFFHSETAPENASVDVYLDETGRGLTGNIALVVDLAPLGALGDAAEVLQRLARLWAGAVAEGARRPVTLRLRLDDAADSAPEAESEVRFKVRLSGRLIARGAGATRELVRASVQAFERLLGADELRSLFDGP